RRGGEGWGRARAPRPQWLGDRLLRGYSAGIDGSEVNGRLERRLPGNLNVSIPGTEAETLLLAMGNEVAVSSGAACAEAGGKGSHVLRALGLPDERVYGSLRFGVGRFNTEAEIDRAVSVVKDAVAAARSRAGARRS